MAPSSRRVRIPLTVATALVLAAAPYASAKTEQSSSDPVKLTRTRGTNVRLSARGKTRVVALPEFSGCLDQLYDPSTDEYSAADSTLRVLDEAAVSNRVYVLIQTVATSGCNVQGYCGAGTESSLLWLEIDAKTLRITSRQVQPLMSCFDNWELTEPAASHGNDVAKLQMRDGRLSVVSQRDDFERNETITVRSAYDRRRPTAGFDTATTRKPI